MSAAGCRALRCADDARAAGAVAACRFTVECDLFKEMGDLGPPLPPPPPLPPLKGDKRFRRGVWPLLGDAGPSRSTWRSTHNVKAWTIHARAGGGRTHGMRSCAIPVVASMCLTSSLIAILRKQSRVGL